MDLSIALRLLTSSLKIEIEVVYNNTCITRLVSLAPPVLSQFGLISVGRP
jgi:hypothetical protein